MYGNNNQNRSDRTNTGYTEHNGAFVSYKTNRWWFTKKWAGILD